MKFIVDDKSPAKDNNFWKVTQDEISVCLKYDEKRTTFVDIGSNEGIWSLFLNGLYEEIHAFEPIKKNYNHLKHNLSDFKNIISYNNAISDKKENFTMVNDCKMVDFNQGMTARKQNFVNAVKEFTKLTKSEALKQVNSTCFFERVSSNTLDSYSFSPSLIKIDVENDEIRVLTGAKNTIKKYSPVLFIENNFEPLSNELNNLIRDYDYVSVSEHPWIHIKNKE